MKHSDKIDQIAKALVLAQGNMGAVIKNEKAQVFSKRTGGNFTYTYADLAAVLDVITPALQAQGIAFIQCPGGEPGVIEIETMLMHAESGQWLSSTLPLRLPTDDPQDAGKVITYLRRYAALAMCGLAAEDNDGKIDIKKQPSKPGNAPPPADSPAVPTGGELMARAVAIGEILTPDRAMFLDWARAKVPGCATMRVMTPAFALKVDAHLANLESLLPDDEELQ